VTVLAPHDSPNTDGVDLGNGCFTRLVSLSKICVCIKIKLHLHLVLQIQAIMSASKTPIFPQEMT